MKAMFLIGRDCGDLSGRDGMRETSVWFVNRLPADGRLLLHVSSAGGEFAWQEGA